jgi:hypothetical protein
MIILLLLGAVLFWGFCAFLVLAILAPVIGPPIRWLDDKYCNWECARSMRRQERAARVTELPPPSAWQFGNTARRLHRASAAR